jgi:hypothetical protein
MEIFGDIIICSASVLVLLEMQSKEGCTQLICAQPWTNYEMDYNTYVIELGFSLFNGHSYQEKDKLVEFNIIILYKSLDLKISTKYRGS